MMVSGVRFFGPLAAGNVVMLRYACGVVRASIILSVSVLMGGNR